MVVLILELIIVVFIERKFILYSKNCLSGTPYDFITSLLIQYINKTNKNINLI